MDGYRIEGASFKKYVSYMIWTNEIYISRYVDGACGTYGGRERCAQGFGGET